MSGWRRWTALGMVIFSSALSFGADCDFDFEADEDGIWIDIDDDDDDFDWDDLFD